MVRRRDVRRGPSEPLGGRLDEDGARPGSAGPPFAETADLLQLGMAYQMVTERDGSGRRFVKVGRLSRQLTGFTPAEVVADPGRLYERILPEHRRALERAEAAAAATLSRFEVEVRMHGASGAVCWRRITSTPTPQPDGTIVWNGIMMDITPMRRATERLDAQRQRLEAAVEATGLGFWEWDVRTGRVVWAERNAALFGLAPERQTMTIERYASLVHPEDRTKVREAYQRTRDGGGGDFVIEHRTTHQPGPLTRWVLARGRVVKDERGVSLVVGTTLDISELRAAEDDRALLLGELAHRAKNGIQVMMGIVAQTARSVASVDEFAEVLKARLSAMAASQDLVTASGGLPVRLGDVVLTTLTPFDTARFKLDAGLQEVTVAGEVAVAMALLLHEFSTNAVKYGALSASSGRVVLRRCEAAGPGRAGLEWAEEGGPPLVPSTRKGFGSRLIEVGLRAQGGEVEPLFDPAGFRARICFPAAAEASAGPGE